MSKKSEKEAEKQEAIANLKSDCLQPGKTVYTVLRHASASGMMREISLHVVAVDFSDVTKLPVISDITWLAAKALGDKIGKHGGIRVPGCGMDMGFHVVYCLSSTLYHDDLPTRQGYALKQRWL